MTQTLSKAERPHGYARYKLDSCRCYVCGFANSEYTRDREKQIIAGTWRVDTEMVRVHVRGLQAVGMGTRRIAELAGVNRKTLQIALNGRADRGTPPPKTMRRDLAEAVLAVEPDVAPHQPVEASGTVRRIQALCAGGRTLTAVAEATGWTTTNLSALVKRGSVPYAATVLARSAKTFKDLYDRESGKLVTGARGVAARKRARRHGWFPAAAWDDDTIDDPDTHPCLLPAMPDSDSSVDELRIQQAAAGFVIEPKLTWREKIEIVYRMGDHTDQEIAAIIQVQVQSVGSMRSDHPARVAARLAADRGTDRRVAA